MTARRIIGMETEFGILEPGQPYANPIVLSSEIVEAYGAAGAASGPGAPVRWDFHGEDPLNDARGFRMERAAAHPSQLTDDPDHMAPSGDAPRLERLARPETGDLLRPRAANAVLTNGARLYVDHAHPEYSSPETANPRETVLWDRAGEVIMDEAMRLLSARGRDVVIYKNNVDGKGAAYGSHENYLVERSVAFVDIIRYLTPFFVTRPILCGAGRVGVGQKSEVPGFQISQRADYVENDIGLETTFNRPIINTRDEPHADSARWRRLHVIGGDANLFDISTLLKVGTTSLVLWLLESGEVPLDLDALQLEDPVTATWEVSHDPSLTVGLDMHDGSTMTALDIQQVYLDVVRRAVERREQHPDFDTQEILRRWQDVLDALRCDVISAAPQVEWVAKYALLEGMRQRGNLSWDNDKLRALDLQWHDLRPERSIVHRLDAAGRVERIFTPAQVAYAALHAPESTRAYLRGALIERFADHVAAAGWDGIVLDVPGYEHLVRLPLLRPQKATRELVGGILEGSQSVEDFLIRLMQG
ncbi:MAG: proteasome accessory factor PafA2 [Ancrocorticia sp.]|jgi:proteasome accessory factor A|nr:proteasome accessory factor PafA2 [Ancrocorticia sp.]MCI1895452.1 proteasome accessory factor PafA2 [Ancrocorticia sp.]MCI1932125.1 proteasome accessory factor PafA2 [Ancrocorticia sp.]MCI1963485.1 proteasome accessory factor PafA2 [Ancrocorticia sp.]MCI2002321.1 proteasome accessory factor PafA2 [Ancrocorticia sp.]